MYFQIARQRLQSSPHLKRFTLNLIQHGAFHFFVSIFAEADTTIVWASSQDSSGVFVFAGPYVSPVTENGRNPERRDRFASAHAGTLFANSIEGQILNR